MKTTATKERARELVALVGDPGNVARDLGQFRCSAILLSSQHADLARRYARKWVAIHGEEVVTADSLEGLLLQVDERGFSRERVLVRYMGPDERVLIV